MYTLINAKGLHLMQVDGNIKEVYQRPDGALKIRYYDNSDTLVIADIAD